MPQPLPFQRPLVKISGEALAGSAGFGIDTAILSGIALDISSVAKTGRRLAVVVGGGNIFRGLSGVAQGMNRVKADHLGMLATVMNAVALQEALASCGQAARVYSGLQVPSVCETYRIDTVRDDLSAGVVAVLAGGTGNPFFTTDTAAVLRAAELGCDCVLKATQVDGVYSADPALDPHARRFDTITFSDALSLNLKVMDATAIALARECAIPIGVFSIREKGAIGRVFDGEAKYTLLTGGAESIGRATAAV